MAVNPGDGYGMITGTDQMLLRPHDSGNRLPQGLFDLCI